jgi:hypothetical protein
MSFDTAGLVAVCCIGSFVILILAAVNVINL